MAKAVVKAKDGDRIDLTQLPTDKLADKARVIMDEISKGECYTKFRGKRMKYNRSMISIPLNRRYRLVYTNEGGEMLPIAAVSHSEYNAKKPMEITG